MGADAMGAHKNEKESIANKGGLPNGNLDRTRGTREITYFSGESTHTGKLV